jgi:tRNA(Leu) C34 or U34 (ribose-2'-O)-methylase TrmL
MLRTDQEIVLYCCLCVASPHINNNTGNIFRLDA